MKTFETPAGIRIAYQEFGSGGTPLVLLHGWTGSAADFAGQAQALGAGRRVLVPDLRGHGGSDPFGKPEDITFASLLEDLVAFLQGVVKQPAHVLGHSMGGMIALRAALDARVSLASLILMDTSAEPITHVNKDAVAMAGRVAREEGMAKLSALLRQLESQSKSRTPASEAHETTWGERYWEWRQERLLAMDPNAYEAFVHAMVEQESLVPVLSRIAVPTLVMVGSQDQPFLRPSGVMAAGIPDAWLFLIAGAAHQPQFEAPDRWRAVLEAHLDRVDAGAVAAR